jgi:hypothetical protein
MKNGTRSNRLTLVDSAGQDLSSDREDAADSGVSSGADAQQDRQTPAGNPILILFTVSIACAAAAIAAGSYGLWLARQKAARRTLTDVQDILRLCQERMQKMDAELGQLPQGLSSAETAG